MWSRLRPEDQNFGLGLDHGLENMVSVLSSVSKSCCHLTSVETAEFIRGCLETRDSEMLKSRYFIGLETKSLESVSVLVS